MTRSTVDEGSATVEFAMLSLLLLVPFTYVLLTVFQIQRAAYGVTEAAREGARAFVTAQSGDLAQPRLDAAVTVALHDQGLEPPGVQVRLGCSMRPCLTPGATVTVTVDDQVELPWIPTLLGRPVASVLVRAVQVQTVDVFRAARP